MIDISKKILITGASGYIWWAFLQKLLKIWAKNVHVMSHEKKILINWVQNYTCDISSREETLTTIDKIKPELIFHFAALGSKNSKTKYSLNDLIAVNGIWTVNLIDAAEKVGTCIWFLNLSSAYEYGPQKLPLNEKSPLEPHWHYGLSKTIGSIYGLSRAKIDHFPLVTYRVFSVYWPWDEWRIIPLIIDAFLLKKELKLFDINRKYNYIHLDNLITSILEFDKVLARGIKILNISGCENITITKILKIVSQITQKPIPANLFFEEKKKITTHWVADNTLFNEILSIPPISFTEGIKWIILSHPNFY